jgi:ribosomal protein S18 acetylase RimI-like enzyme
MIQESVIPASENPPPLSTKEVSEARSRGDQIYWLQTTRKDRVGYYWIERRSEHLFLASLVIGTSFRNQKIGRRVLEWVDQAAEKQGYTRCGLAVVPINSSALHLYLSHGYQIIRCNPNYFGSTCPNKFRLILERSFEKKNQDEVFQERIQVVNYDYPSLMQATEQGFIGTAVSADRITFQR